MHQKRDHLHRRSRRRRQYLPLRRGQTFLQDTISQRSQKRISGRQSRPR